MIVDTSFILDVIDGVEAAVEKERELEAESIPLVIPSMTFLTVRRWRHTEITGATPQPPLVGAVRGVVGHVRTNMWQEQKLRCC